MKFLINKGTLMLPNSHKFMREIKANNLSINSNNSKILDQLMIINQNKINKFIRITNLSNNKANKLKANTLNLNKRNLNNLKNIKNVFNSIMKR